MIYLRLTMRFLALLSLVLASNCLQVNRASGQDNLLLTDLDMNLCEAYSSPPPDNADSSSPNDIENATDFGSYDEAGEAFEPATDPTNGCTENLPQLPNNCTVYRGTNYNARWLWCWHEVADSEIMPRINTTWNTFRSACEIPDSDITTIALRCNVPVGSQDKLMCVIDQIRNIISRPRNVCRHFGRCFKYIWEEMGYSQSYIIGNGRPGHVWNEINTTNPSGTYYVDSSNNIMFWCSNS
jgi:hypothetical protein